MNIFHIRQNKKRLIITTLVIAILAIPGVFVFGQTLEELNKDADQKRQEIDDLNEKMNTIEEEIEKRRSEAASLNNQLVIIDNEILKAETKIQQTETEIDKTNIEIQETSAKIKSNQEEIEKQQEILSGIIRTIYQYDRVGLLEIVFNYNSLSDFLDQTQYLESVEKEGRKVLDNIKKIKKELQWQEQVLNTRKETLDELKSKLDKERLQLEIEKQSKQRLLEETEEQEEKYQELLQGAREEQEVANVEIERLQKEIEAKILESQRTSNKNIEDDDWKSLSGDGKFDWPIYPNRGISAYFMDPSYYAAFGINHYGIDIPAPQGTSIHAPAKGYVIRYRDAGYGYSYLVLYHGNGISTVFGHVNMSLVTEGQHIDKGDVIGLSGGMPGTRGAGWLTTGPHLHFEIRENGTPVDPLGYLVSL